MRDSNNYIHLQLTLCVCDTHRLHKSEEKRDIVDCGLLCSLTTCGNKLSQLVTHTHTQS